MLLVSFICFVVLQVSYALRVVISYVLRVVISCFYCVYLVPNVFVLSWFILCLPVFYYGRNQSMIVSGLGLSSMAFSNKQTSNYKRFTCIFHFCVYETPNCTYRIIFHICTQLNSKTLLHEKALLFRLFFCVLFCFYSGCFLLCVFLVLVTGRFVCALLWNNRRCAGSLEANFHSYSIICPAFA